MYDKILVPLDGSELAEVSLPYAEEIAARLGSEITLIYLSRSEKDPSYRMHQVYLEKVLDSTTNEIQKLLKKPSEEAKIESAVLVGHPAEEIVKHADKEDMGLIVIATHGRSGIKQWAMGSVASKIITATRRPIMLIRAKEASPDIRDKGAINKILLPLDGSTESETIVPHAQQIASSFNSEVVLFQTISLAYPTYTADAFAYVTYSDQQMDAMKASALDYLEKIGSSLKEKGIEVKSDVRFGSAADEIINYADEIDTDLIAMTTHGRSGIGRWLFGSTTVRVMKGGNANLLLVRV
jgi:nucleotide-binding universal stress UspA family protein